MFGWYGPWGPGPWSIVPMVLCVAMMLGMMLLMGHGHMGGHADEETPADPALDTLRRRLASGAITPQEYEEQRQLLLAA